MQATTAKPDLGELQPERKSGRSQLTAYRHADLEPTPNVAVTEKLELVIFWKSFAD